MIESERSGGNLFEDMGVPDAENMKVRAELIVEIRSLMEENAWTQTEAAKKFGISRTRLNDILRGRLEKVTIDRLVTMLATAGRHVHVTVNNAA